MGAQGLEVLGRTVYRHLLRSARLFDRQPVLKALIGPDFARLPKALEAVVNAYLGGASLYVPTPLLPRSVMEAVRMGFRFPPEGHSLDDGLLGLRYLKSLAAIGAKHNLAGPVDSGASGQDRHDLAGSGEQAPASQASEPGVMRVAPPMHTRGSAEAGGGERAEVAEAPAAGVVLVAHPMQTGEFARAVVLLCSHGPAAGAAGVILNRPPICEAWVVRRFRRHRQRAEARAAAEQRDDLMQQARPLLSGVHPPLAEPTCMTHVSSGMSGRHTDEEAVAQLLSSLMQQAHFQAHKLASALQNFNDMIDSARAASEDGSESSGEEEWQQDEPQEFVEKPDFTVRVQVPASASQAVSVHAESEGETDESEEEDEREASPRHFAKLLDLSPEWVEGVLDDSYVRGAADPAERSTRAAFRALILATLRRMDGALGQQLARNRGMARALRRMLEEGLQVELPRAREGGAQGGPRAAAGGPGGDEPGSGARWRRRGVWLRRRRGPNGEAEPLEALGANAVYLGGPGSGVQVLHQEPNLGGVQVLPPWDGGPGIYYGGLNQAARAVGMGVLEPSRVRLFEGEATWMPGQLEDELAAGAWIALRLPRAMLESLVKRGPAQMDADIKRLVEAPPVRKPRDDDEAGGGSAASMAQGVAAWHKGNRGWLLRRMAMQRSDPAWRCALTAAGGEFAALSRIPDGVADDLARLSV